MGRLTSRKLTLLSFALTNFVLQLTELALFQIILNLYLICLRYLGYSLDSSKIRSQDAISVISYVASNPVGKYLAWTFVQNNWKALFDM